MRGGEVAAATGRPVIVGQRWGSLDETGKTDGANRAFSTVTGTRLMIVGHPRLYLTRMAHDHPGALGNASRLSIASSIFHL
jgi:hypothetical protein